MTGEERGLSSSEKSAFLAISVEALEAALADHDIPLDHLHEHATYLFGRVEDAQSSADLKNIAMAFSAISIHFDAVLASAIDNERKVLRARGEDQLTLQLMTLDRAAHEHVAPSNMERARLFFERHARGELDLSDYDAHLLFMYHTAESIVEFFWRDRWRTRTIGDKHWSGRGREDDLKDAQLLDLLDADLRRYLDDGIEGLVRTYAVIDHEVVRQPLELPGIRRWVEAELVKTILLQSKALGRAMFPSHALHTICDRLSDDATQILTLLQQDYPS